MRSLQELAKEAIAVQDACNLSGVVHSFSKVLSELWEHAHKEGKGTDWVNHHPISVLFADKIAHLTNTQDQATNVLADAWYELRKLKPHHHYKLFLSDNTCLECGQAWEVCQKENDSK